MNDFTGSGNATKHGALVELGGSHFECLYSQVLFLNEGGYRVHLLCTEDGRKQVDMFPNLHRLVFFEKGKGFKGHWKLVRSVLRYIRENDIGMVVFNTGSGNDTRDIALFLPRTVRLVGVVHHTHKLKKSFTQFLISLRVKKNFVLNDYLLDAVPPSRRSAFESIYLIFREPIKISEQKREAGTLYLAIPGEVDFRRRDYAALITALRRNGGSSLPVRFLLLGECKRDGDGRTLRTMIIESGLERNFVLFDRFVDRETFFGFLLHADALLPLIHPGLHFFSHYQRYQVSGTYNLAFGYAKPMLLHEALKGPDDFDVAAFFYEDGGLSSLLTHLINHPEELRTKEVAIKQFHKFSFDAQCRKYLHHLSTT